MQHNIEHTDEKRGMRTATAMLLGLGIGIVGTVIVIGANEEKFGRAVKMTKKRAREFGETVHDKYDDVLNNSKEHGAKAAYAVERGAKKVGDKLSE